MQSRDSERAINLTANPAPAFANRICNKQKWKRCSHTRVISISTFAPTKIYPQHSHKTLSQRPIKFGSLPRSRICIFIFYLPAAPKAANRSRSSAADQIIPSHFSTSPMFDWWPNTRVRGTGANLWKRGCIAMRRLHKLNMLISRCFVGCIVTARVRASALDKRFAIKQRVLW